MSPFEDPLSAETLRLSELATILLSKGVFTPLVSEFGISILGFLFFRYKF